MNLLMVSSSQWTPEREWVRLGVQNLFARLFSDIHWVLYDINPDLTSFDGISVTHRFSLKSNSFRHQSLLPFSAVVIAGGDTWVGGPLELLYGLVAKNELPLYFLGIELPRNPKPLSPLDLNCLSRHDAIFAVRDERTRLWLERQAVETSVLPCPSVFLDPPLPTPTATRPRIAFVLEDSQKEGSAVSESTLLSACKMVSDLQKIYQVEVISLNVDDFMRFSTLFREIHRYDFRSEKAMSFLSGFDVIVTFNPYVVDLAIALETKFIYVTDSIDAFSGQKDTLRRSPVKIEGVRRQIQTLLHEGQKIEMLRSWKESARTEWLSFFSEKKNPLLRKAA